MDPDIIMCNVYAIHLALLGSAHVSTSLVNSLGIGKAGMCQANYQSESQYKLDESARRDLRWLFTPISITSNSTMKAL